MSKIKTIIWCVVALFAVLGVGAFAVQAMPIQTTPNNTTTVTPDDTNDTGGTGDYSNLVKLNSHTICESQENTYPSVGVAESFDGTFASYMNFAGYTPNANCAGLAPAISYFDLAKVEITSFGYEIKQYTGQIELENGLKCDVFGSEENVFDIPLTVANTYYYYNGELTTYEAISANQNKAFGVVKTFGVIDYVNNTVDLYSVFVVVEVGETYTSADGSVSVKIGSGSMGGKVTAPDIGSIYFCTVNGLGLYYPDGSEEPIFGLSILPESYSNNFYFEMIDYNTFSYNGVTLTKTE